MWSASESLDIKKENIYTGNADLSQERCATAAHNFVLTAILVLGLFKV